MRKISDCQLRSYSSAFSRNVFSDIANFSDFSHLDWLISHYGDKLKNGASYMDYLAYIYSIMTRDYRNEYIFKNEIINQLLIKKYGTRNTIAFNEFKVGDSIVDFAMMNGESKAFEIKTTFDSPKRLEKQMKDYKRIFNKRYIVVDADECSYYRERIEDTTGIVALCIDGYKITMEEYRPAANNEEIDAKCIMKCLHTIEYKNIIVSYFGYLPKVNSFEMYDECENLLMQIPSVELNKLFINEVKKRQSVTPVLKSFPKEIRQIMLALNLSTAKQEVLLSNLNKQINKERPCIIRI